MKDKKEKGDHNYISDTDIKNTDFNLENEHKIKYEIVLSNTYELPNFIERGTPTFQDLRNFANTIGYKGSKYGLTKLEFYESLKLFITKKNISKNVVIPVKSDISLQSYIQTSLHKIYQDTDTYLKNIDKEREINHQKLMNRLKQKKYCSI